MNMNDDFWTLKAAEAIIRAVNAAHDGDADALKKANNGIAYASAKIKAKRETA